MVAATKTRTRTKRRRERDQGFGASGLGKNGDGRAAEPPAKREEILPADILVDRIDRCPFQPRVDFPEQEIADLAASIAAQGQIHPIAVRVAPGHTPLKPRYELVDGERRWRAVKLLGWPTIRAEIAEHSDAQVRAIVLATAIQRKELGAIEEALAFQAAIDAGDAPGPTELARQLGLSQGHVSNRLRLLELPDKVQAKIISREISATEARDLVPYRDAPAVLAAVLKEKKSAGGELSGDEFRDALDDAVSEHCRALDGRRHYDPQSGRDIPPLKINDEHREALRIIKHTPNWPGAKPVEYATNTDLYDQLWEAHKAATIERAEKKKGKEEKRKARDSGKPLTPAEKKQQAAEERRRERERAAKLARGLWTVAIDWRRRLIAEMLGGKESSGGAGVTTVGVNVEDTFRLLLYFAAAKDWRRWDCDCSMPPQYRNATERFDKRELLLWNGLVSAGVRTGGCKKGRPNLFPGLQACSDQEVLDRANDFLANLFWNEDFGPQTIPDATLLEITEHLGIDLAAAWKKDALGPLTERWLNLRDKESLGELARTWGSTGVGHATSWLDVVATCSKKDAVSRMADAARFQKPPAELIKPKKPKK